MSAPDHVSSFIASHTNALHALLASPHRLHAWVVLSLEARTLVVLPTVEATPDDPEFPAAHRATFASELAKPRAEDELLAFFVEGEGMTVVRTNRARIARELAAPFVLDPRIIFQFHGRAGGAVRTRSIKPIPIGSTRPSAWSWCGSTTPGITASSMTKGIRATSGDSSSG